MSKNERQVDNYKSRVAQFIPHGTTLELIFIGPLSPVSQSGNQHILVISDYFIKWVTTAALQTKEDVGVAYELKVRQINIF